MSKKTTIPLYQQIKDHISAKIDQGIYRRGMKIPSEAELSAHFNTSRMTVNRALRELSSAGRIYRQQGRGSFVAPAKKLSPFFEIRSISEEIQQRGGNHSCHIHHLGREKASPELADIMQLLPYDNVYHSILIHCDDTVPIQLADRYINPSVAPDYLEQDFTQATPSEYLLKIAPVTEVEHVVEALIPEVWIRTLLQTSDSEPCLVLKRTTWSEKQVATRSTFYYPGSRYSLGGRFTPSDSGVATFF